MDPKLSESLGRAYGRAPGRPDPVLTQVGPGTPGGELLRRYWQPIALSAEATTVPKRIRRFGEDLILFRTGAGKVGLVTPYCIHRGASLFYGKVDKDGIRCAYHGWKFGCQGAVMDMPCEPDRGERIRHKLRQPWYPVQEQFGAIWAYMGPPEKQPLFPIFSCFDRELAKDEGIFAVYMNTDRGATDFPARFNWFQHFDNGPDHYHLQILHWEHSGPQFHDKRYGVPAQIEFSYSDAADSVLVTSRRDLGNREVWVRVEQILTPNIYALPPFYGDGPCNDLWFFIPFDDSTYVQMSIGLWKKDFVFNLRDFHGMGPEMKLWHEMTPEEHQQYPSDMEVQGSQWGGLTCHSEENLAASDVGVVKNRLLWKRQVKAVQEGANPVNVAFRESDRRIRIVGASWVERNGKKI